MTPGPTLHWSKVRLQANKNATVISCYSKNQIMSPQYVYVQTPEVCRDTAGGGGQGEGDLYISHHSLCVWWSAQTCVGRKAKRFLFYSIFPSIDFFKPSSNSGSQGCRVTGGVHPGQFNQFSSHSARNPICMFLDVRVHTERPQPAGFKPRTLLLWGDSAHCFTNVKEGRKCTEHKEKLTFSLHILL